MNWKCNVMCVLGPMALLLSGCADPTLVKVKDIAADPSSYFSKNLSPESISPTVAAKLPTGNAKFDQLKLTTKIDFVKGDKTESRTAVITYLNKGNGRIGKMIEFSNNDVPYEIDYLLTYQGIVSLGWQNVNLGYTYANPHYEMKDTPRFDPILSEVGKEFTVKYMLGAVNQTRNFTAYELTCKASGTRPASTIYSGFVGQATDFNCGLLSNNIMIDRQHFAMLQQYGVAVLLDVSTSSMKIVYQVVGMGS